MEQDNLFVILIIKICFFCNVEISFFEGCTDSQNMSRDGVVPEDSQGLLQHRILRAGQR